MPQINSNQTILRDAISRFREIDEATTSGAVGSHTTGGLPFYGREGLRQIEKQRRRRLKTSNQKCKGYDPECRDKEWEVPAPTGGVVLLRRGQLR